MFEMISMRLSEKRFLNPFFSFSFRKGDEVCAPFLSFSIWRKKGFRPHFLFSIRKGNGVEPQKEKRAVQNQKCIPCRHRVRGSQLHSVSAGAAKTPYPQPSSSFPNCDRFTGSQFGHLEFYNAARDLDDGGQTPAIRFCDAAPPKGDAQRAETFRVVGRDGTDG